ncbi:uncharacterized protein LOC122502472, partial [Leptopilina heterotoma]|uniref:uncharacterized protein LOC122502472 n=1 Tax=Leptopilina heterotoma TaxID=63436 RepID=UPI001CA8332C
DYGDDENDEDDDNNLKTSTTLEASTTTTTSTTTSTTTTTTTTTTPKPTEAVFFPKSITNYERSTGAQYNGYQSKNDYPPMSAHSVQKWKHLGSRESVKETRDKYPEFKNNGKSAEVNEALQHAIKVSREGSCQWPRARIVPVRDVYPSTSTTYIPHCAILHRCSDDTGCCRSEALTCVPKQSHRVELYFYTTNLEGSSVVEKLTFYNHTECECRERTEIGVKVEKTAETRFARHHPPIIPQNLRKLPPKKPCRCPSEFLPKITPDAECQCKCSDTDQNCIRTRRGKVYFSIRDRLCIHNGDCTQPICEFGEYMSRQGKCPRKQEQYSFYSKYHTNVHHGLRS